MPKKSFKANPAMAFINATQEDAQEATLEPIQEAVREVTHEDTQEAAQERTQYDTPFVPQYANTQQQVQHLTHEATQEVTQEVGSGIRRPYVRTQGRKGCKKPRINLAFDSEVFLNEIKERADREGMSITQLVNEACAFYLDNTK